MLAVSVNLKIPCDFSSRFYRYGNLCLPEYPLGEKVSGCSDLFYCTLEPLVQICRHLIG